MDWLRLPGSRAASSGPLNQPLLCPQFIKILNSGPCHSLNRCLLGVRYVLGTVLDRESIILRLFSYPNSPETTPS